MATLTNTRAASTFPVFKGLGAGVLCAAYGTYEIAANPTAADIIEFCRVPKGAVVLGGWLMGDDLDTGVETIDIDIGWAGNGTDAADPDGFGNFGVLSGDVITELKPVAGIYNPLQGVLLTTGPQAFAAETIIQGVVNAAAATGGTGTITLVVLYVVP